MIGTIRRHSQWLWIFIIIVVVISFVIYFSPQAKLRPEREVDYGSYRGRKIHKEELQAGAREASLNFFFSYRAWPGENELVRQLKFDADQEARRRIVVAEKLKELGIQVDDDSVARQIRQLFTDPATKQFQLEGYNNFVKQTLNPRGLTGADFEQFLRAEIGRSHLIALFGQSGRLMSARAAEPFFRRENEQLVTEAVFFSLTNHLASVPVTTNSVKEYFTNNQAKYRLPERMQVSYVRLEATNFLAEADRLPGAITNVDAEVDRRFLALGTNALMEGTNVLSTEVAKEKIRQEVQIKRGLPGARKKANELYGKLGRMQPPSATNLLVVATEAGYTVQDTEPFEKFELPKDAGFPAAAGGAIATLTEEEPLAEPMEGTNAVFVVTFKRKLPSEAQSFAAVQEKVTEDYRRAQAQELVLKAGRDFHRALTNSLAEGKTFQSVCTNNLLTPVELAPFGRTTSDLPEIKGQVNVNQFKGAALSTKPGAVSTYQQTRDGGFIVFVREVRPVSEEKLKAELEEYTDGFRDNRSSMAYQEWMRRELERSGLFTGVAKQPGEGEPVD
jgi:hypothetical protein